MAQIPSIKKGATLHQTLVTVSNGLFTVKLDFGNQFPGDARWLEIWASTNTQPVVQLIPRQELTPSGRHPLRNTAATVTNQAITAFQLAPGAVTGPAIANGNVVRALNGLTDALTLAAGANISLGTVGNTITVSSTAGSGPAWLLSGNGGTDPSTNFLVTTDNKALEIKVNGQRGLRLEPTTSAPNLIAGSQSNLVSAAAAGSTIGGGGYALGKPVFHQRPQSGF